MAWGVAKVAGVAMLWLLPRAGADVLIPAVPQAETWVVDFVAGGPGQVRKFESFHAFSISEDWTPGQVAMYDPEPTGSTPFREASHPKRYMRHFVQIARDRGLQTMLAPGFQLPKSDRDCRYHSFIKCGYAEIKSDFLLLQAQRQVCDLAGFTKLVARVHRQVTGHLIVELTVAWPADCLKPDVILAAHEAALPYADSFSLWSSPSDRYRDWDQQMAWAKRILTTVSPAV